MRQISSAGTVVADLFDSLGAETASVVAVPFDPWAQSGW